MKRRFVWGLVALVGAFGLLFGLRLGYGYWTHPEGSRVADDAGAEAADFSYERKNYASRKLARGTAAAPLVVDQKYEKVAALRTRTKDFPADERRVFAAVADSEGLVQFEQRAGLEGRRVLHLAVGVDPARFDALTAALRTVGELRSLEVHKVDRTNEFRELKATQTALVKTRDALAGLKGPDSGRLEERVQLEERILAVDERIQQLGVQLGEFDDENEFCTVKLTLAEAAPPAVLHIPLADRARVAFEWAAPLYRDLVTTGAAGALLVLLFLLVLERLARVPGLWRRIVGVNPEAPAS